MTLAYGQQAPWPFIPDRHAAKQLNVTIEYLDGIARNGAIPAVRAQNRRGRTVWLFKKTAIEALTEALTSTNRDPRGGTPK